MPNFCWDSPKKIVFFAGGSGLKSKKKTINLGVSQQIFGPFCFVRALLLTLLCIFLFNYKQSNVKVVTPKPEIISK